MPSVTFIGVTIFLFLATCDGAYGDGSVHDLENSWGDNPTARMYSDLLRKAKVPGVAWTQVLQLLDVDKDGLKLVAGIYKSLFGVVEGLSHESAWRLRERRRQRSVKRHKATADKCATDLDTYFWDIIDHVVAGNGTYDWSLKMFDSMGKIPEGISDGNFHWVGQFDQCYEVKASYNLTDILEIEPVTLESFNGKYCDVELADRATPGNATRPLSVIVGCCFPHTCNNTEAYEWTNELLDDMQLLTGLDVRVHNVKCFVDPYPSPSSYWPFKAAIAVTMVLVILTLVSSVYDGIFRLSSSGIATSQTSSAYSRDTDQKPDSVLATPVPSYYPVTQHEMQVHSNGNLRESVTQSNALPLPTSNSSTTDLLKMENDVKKPLPMIVANKVKSVILSFSLYENVPRLLRTDNTRGPFQVLYAIRFLSISWVILAYNFLIFPITAEKLTCSNILQLLRSIQKQWQVHPILNSGFANDAFFVIAGLLTAYHFLRAIERSNGKITLNIMVRYYLHRLWRIWPTYMLCLMFYSCFYKYFISRSPLYPGNITDADNCFKNWWANFLFINNFVDTNHLCMLWSWFLPCLVQLHIVMPLILIPLAKKPIAGYVIYTIFFVAHIVSVAVLSHKIHSSASLDDKVGEFFNNIFITPWGRAGSYLIGILLGYVFVRTKGEVKLHPAVAFFGWCAALVCVWSVNYGTFSDFREGSKPWSLPVNVVYDTLSSTSFSLGVAWVIFACVTGYAGVIDTILCWAGWIPLGRLTFVAFLIAPPFIFSNGYSNMKLIYLSINSNSDRFIGNTFYIFCFAFVLSLIYEQTVKGIERTLFGVTDSSASWQKTRLPRSEVNKLEMPTVEVLNVPQPELNTKTSATIM